jgi:3-oxoacyl-[acyl-carrier protein] reductase
MGGELTGRVAIVTGGGGGFGKVISTKLGSLGAIVWAFDVNEEWLKESRTLCDDKCMVWQGSVTDPENLAALVEEVGKVHGRIDILVNNAGGSIGQTFTPVEDVSPEAWHAMIDVNLTGTFNCIRAVAPMMKSAGTGRIVNISSRAGLYVGRGNIQAYTAAKAGVIGLTRQMARELGAWNITVNSVAPGFVHSNVGAERLWESLGEAGQKQLVESLYLRRLGKPEDVANAVAFFTSDDANWITGQILVVDGGS